MTSQREKPPAMSASRVRRRRRRRDGRLEVDVKDMRLTYLAPGIVKDLFEGRQPEALTAARLVSVCKDLPHDWELQRGFLGFETR